MLDKRANPNRVSWITPAVRQPVCDVPWLGTSVVLSDGRVNFCCFSDAAVGNVNTETLQAIWNGPIIQRIRSELLEQRLPLECQCNSCPIYRGDALNYIVDRVAGPYRFEVTGTHDPHAEVRERLRGSDLRILSEDLKMGDPLDFILEFRRQGDPIAVDLFIGVHSPQGVDCFLPDCESFAVPFQPNLQLREGPEPMQFKAMVPPEWLRSIGRYELCAALFEGDSNPNQLSNCYWSALRSFTVRA